jgi:hypothetical protein
VIKKLYFSMPCEQKGLATAYKPAPGWTTPENLPAPHNLPNKTWAQIPGPIPPKAVQQGGATSIETHPRKSILRKDKDTEKVYC